LRSRRTAAVSETPRSLVWVPVGCRADPEAGLLDGRRRRFFLATRV